MTEPRDGRRTRCEPVWVHDGPCGGPVYFELAGGFCWQCGAGRLYPDADTWRNLPAAARYTHQSRYDGGGWLAQKDETHGH